MIDNDFIDYLLKNYIHKCFELIGYKYFDCIILSFKNFWFTC